MSVESPQSLALGSQCDTSDKDDGPTAGRYTFEPTAFIARLVAHIPDKGQALQRYYGYYANRARGERRKAQARPAVPTDGGAAPDADDPSLRAVAIVEPEDFNRTAARLRWAELLRLIYEVDPLVCPRCGGPMRVVALIKGPEGDRQDTAPPAGEVLRRGGGALGNWTASRHERPGRRGLTHPVAHRCRPPLAPPPCPEHPAVVPAAR